MRIRPYTEGEQGALLAIFQSSVHGLASRDYTAEQIAAWAPRVLDAESRRSWDRRIDANRPWAVEIDGRPVAFADLQQTGYIDQFFVAPDFAGKGVGTALMRHLLDIASARRLPALFSCVSLTAQPFFARFGFLIEEERTPVVRGVALRNAVMRKTLAE
ncbi:GNAT family N-acetyltransferase [Pseudoduganella albidiflava]|uniref:Acetyltransferase n=1 Tax=Pseudoduganella albidiflava TaxID=321983 RepID=A0A411X098_9BURK|nr:GNAT family N-acetyltransferase [Pseudoduganella albidiflava]QBI02379.1 GNAT family N-acetyltransferase [Pseudoduganella albidiflava]GGY43300.1 acetyltransferase [Pseudoduganella albidiflava]